MYCLYFISYHNQLPYIKLIFYKLRTHCCIYERKAPFHLYFDFLASSSVIPLLLMCSDPLVSGCLIVLNPLSLVCLCMQVRTHKCVWVCVYGRVVLAWRLGCFGVSASAQLPMNNTCSWISETQWRISCNTCSVRMCRSLRLLPEKPLARLGRCPNLSQI